jgi:hypothetical protein
VAQLDPYPSGDDASNGKTAGVIIAVCAGLSILAISHHPTVTQHSPGEALAEIVRLAGVDRVVHGALIALLGGLLVGLFAFSMRQGIARSTVVAGLIAYSIGLGTTIGAAVVDGFLVPGVAAQYAGASSDDVKLAIHLLATCALTIQVLTKVGLVATSIGILMWSLNLVRTRGTVRIVGIIGFAAGIIPASVLLFGAIYLTPSSLGAIFLAHAIWYFAIAALLMRGEA